MKKTDLLLAALMLFIGLSGSVKAENSSAGFNAGGAMVQALKSLNLSDSQKSQIANILKVNRPEVKELAKQLKQSRKDLMSLVKSGEASEQQIRSSFQAMAQYGEEFVVLRAKVRSEVNEVLTAQQKQQAKQLRKQFEDKMNKRIALAGDKLDNWIEENAQ